MIREHKETLNFERRIKKILCGFTYGLAEIMSDKVFALLSIFIAMLLFAVWHFREILYPDLCIDIPYGSSYHIPLSVYDIIFFTLLFIIGFAYVYSFSHPIDNFRYEKGFRRVGLVNKAEEPPFVIRMYESLHHPETAYCIEFDSTGIPLKDWQDNIDDAEAVLNSHIVDIRRGRSMRRIIVELVPAEAPIIGSIPWDDKYIPNTDFEIALGMGVLGLETTDLNVVSHALIAGSTGSGKTIMIKNIIYQCKKKDALIYLVDFKGGANFDSAWDNLLQAKISTEYGLEMLLRDMTDCMNNRKKILAEANCEDITQFNNSQLSNYMHRIIIVFDEVAECFDKKGLSKEAKGKIEEMEHMLSSIARLGRAFGIHLILGLQRPDATVITGQIKSNIDLRMCGRSDDTLSMIVLDNTDAAREIGPYDRGKFMLSNGHLIQGFYFKDSDINL